MKVKVRNTKFGVEVTLTVQSNSTRRDRRSLQKIVKGAVLGTHINIYIPEKSRWDMGKTGSLKLLLQGTQ